MGGEFWMTLSGDFCMTADTLWMASRDLVRMVVGNPRWHLPADPEWVRPQPGRGKGSPAR